ncbi:4Fe-4S dicluster domain-containing protein [Adlercreutzia sp. ZJ473]|uniref:4Fe-4S dicluster domain-containing protein n=1 Tax=Adlercreutzia sp. ZJ473 TaxID=2722822 RepID=UPI001555B869|nr:4Fe-4S dicluster domain-containing protein [Adlercreutzia sp. ZJ473]
MAHYGMLIDLNTCVGCAACAVACKIQNGTPAEMYWCKVIYDEEGTYPHAKKRVLPVSCQHCENAPCVRACPTGASHYDENRNVQIDYDRCIGCRNCMAACPYEARSCNWDDPATNTYFKGFEQTPFETAHASKHPRGVVEKCVLCRDRVSEGKRPACVQTCITESRYFGDLDDPDSTVSKKIRELGARPLLESYGTKPALYYAGLEE